MRDYRAQAKEIIRQHELTASISLEYLITQALQQAYRHAVEDAADVWKKGVVVEELTEEERQLDIGEACHFHILKKFNQLIVAYNEEPTN